MSKRIEAHDIAAATLQHAAGTISLQLTTEHGGVVVDLRPAAVTALLRFIASCPAPSPDGFPKSNIPALGLRKILPFEEGGVPGVWLGVGNAFGVPIALNTQNIEVLRRVLDQAELLAAPPGGHA